MRRSILLFQPFASVFLLIAPALDATGQPSTRLAVVANDARDDTDGLQRYLDEIKLPATAERPPLPAGRLIISDTLRIHKSMGLKFSGSGGQNRSSQAGWDAARSGTILVWQGPPDKPMLELAGCTGLVVEGINFEAATQEAEESRDVSQQSRANRELPIANSPSPAAQCILIRHGTGSLNIAFRDCGFVGGNVGIQCGTAWGESTCANVTYDNCHFEQQSEACVRIVNSQSLEHLFLRPQFAFSPVAIDVQGGGDVSVTGGGTYEMESFLKLGRIGKNARGFDVASVRFDGKTTRTAWLAVADTDAARAYGTITFRNCSQNHGQMKSQSPLVTVGPGARVVLRECSFAGASLVGGNLARIYSDRRAGGELVVENCDGLSGRTLPAYVEAKGNRSYYAFIRCGDLYGPTGSASNYPPSPAGEAMLETVSNGKEEEE
jgi:hypothetical protein